MKSIQRVAAPLLFAVASLPNFAHAQLVPLAPAMAGLFAAGSGVDGTFLKVDDAWQQSTVLWNQATQTYGSGVPVSSYSWGTGLWGIADWKTANLAPTAGMVTGSWTGRVGPISYGDEVYNKLYGATWGQVALAPLFAGAAQGDSQENWTASFSGYIRISDAGTYNFSVLHDDGFFFRLGGASGQTLDLKNDYLNSRDSLGFDSNLQLGVGLYSFELGSYDRLEAGVVELSWTHDGGPLSPVPIDHLVAPGDIMAVPEPGTAALMLAGLLTTGALATRRRSAQG